MKTSISFRCRVALLLLALLVPVGVARAQGTSLVTPSDLAYDDVDRLVQLGVIDGVIVGQRPYSRSEFERIIRVAREQLDRASSGTHFVSVNPAERVANGVVARLESRFGTISPATVHLPAVALLDGAALEFISTDATQRGFPGNLTRRTEAVIEPLPYRRLGPRAYPGSTLAADLQQRFELTSWLAVRARERMEGRVPNDRTRPRFGADLLLASARAVWGNAALTIGREQFAWAQSEGDGLFLASDAPALDQVSIAGNHPFTLPGVLARLGPTQATVLLADLGASRVRSHSRLLAYKVSLQPHRDVELGGTFFNHFGGAGSRPASTGDRLIDFLPFVDIFRTHNYTDTTRSLDVESDKLLGIDGRWRIRQLAGMTLSGEVLIDDFDVHRIPQLLSGYGSSQASILFPVLGTPAWALKLSAKHMGILTYAHGQLSNGITTRGRLLGDELGPDSKAFGAEVTWRPYTGVRISTEGRAALYSNANYAAFYSDSGKEHYVVQKTQTGTNELRDRLLARIELQNDEGLALVIRGGGERVRNFNFANGQRNEYLLDIALRLRM